MGYQRQAAKGHKDGSAVAKPLTNRMHQGAGDQHDPGDIATGLNVRMSQPAGMKNISEMKSLASRMRQGG